jgi:L-ascorbate metabolism protein UlaG (beta-lactamase superfamily)
VQTCIEHFGHTSFAVSRGAQRVLLDPIVVLEELELRQPTCPRWLSAALEPVSAIFLSHGHDDHLHPPSLLGFPEDMAIYFLDESMEGCSCELRPHALLPGLGFRNVHPVSPGDVISLGDGLRIHILPARSSGDGEQQCCFLIETPDVLVLNAVDIKDSPQTRQALEPYRGRLDLAFLPTGASVQWQGYWNQLDAVEALDFCEWLKPARVATCGGSVSMTGQAHPYRLERYPHDRADWMATVLTHMPQTQLVPWRPPFRLYYEEHRLDRFSLGLSSRGFPSARGAPRPQAALTTFFTGYHPRQPMRRWGWPASELANWLEPLEAMRELVRHAPEDLRSLLKRCHLSVNRTPAAVLAPRTLHCLVEGEALEVAARLIAVIPSVPEEPADLDLSFFAVAEAVVTNAPGLPAPLLADLQACLWLDRNFFHLQFLSRHLRKVGSRDARGERLRKEHATLLGDTLARRRPVLSRPYSLRVPSEQVRLLQGKPTAPETAEVLLYATHEGVRQRSLSSLESLLLDWCDGRTCAEIVQEVSAALEVPASEILTAVRLFLTQLTYDSVLVIDWSV